MGPKALPLGDGHVSTTSEIGYVDPCTTTFKDGATRHAGGWINETNSTWNSAAKLAVEGNVIWPNVSNSLTTIGASRIITTNDLPKGYPTGRFLIETTYTLTLNSVAINTPSCVGLVPIGVLTDGVSLYSALDDAGHDANVMATLKEVTDVTTMRRLDILTP